MNATLETGARWLPAWAVRRPVTVLMIFAALAVLGAVAYLRIPLQLLPSGFTPPFLYVSIPARPAPPSDLEASVAIPAEEALGTVRQVRRMRTQVSSSRVNVLLEFEDGADMDTAYGQVRDRLDRARGRWPRDVSEYFIWKYNPANEPVFWLGAVLPAAESAGAGDEAALLESKLIRRLERVPGVSQVEVNGSPEQQIAVEVDEVRANEAGVGVYGVVERLQADNFALPAGEVESGGRRLPLRVVARFEDLEAVRAVPINPAGVTLGEVATVRWAPRAEAPSVYRINGRRGVVLEVFKESEANTVEVCAAVREVVRSGDPALAGFEFVEFFDQGRHIERSLENLEETALWGGLFALIVLFAFLRRGGMTLTITMAIPVSLLMTLVVMYFSGITLNALSLMGLMLSVGMVVDNAIVVVESIQRERQAGRSPREAAVEGAGQVALAILVATSTSIVVFLPLILMSGSQTLSFYLGRIGYPVCVALAASLGVGLALIPLATTLRLGGADKPPPRLPLVERLEGAYGRALGWCLRRRADMALLTLLLLASVAWPMGRLKETDGLGGNPNDMRIYAEFAETTRFEERDAWLQQAEATLQAHAEELGAEQLLVRMRPASTQARLQIFLKDPEARQEQDKAVLAERAMALLPPAPGVRLSTRWGEGEGGSSSVQVALRGPDSAKLAELGEERARRLRQLPGVVSAEPATEDATTRELHLAVEREVARRWGLTPAVVGGSVDYALRGRRLPDFHAPDREVELVVLGPPSRRTSLEALEDFALPSPLAGRGGVPLGGVTTSSVASGYPSILREDRATVLEITVVPEGDDLAGLWADIEGVLATFELPRGVSVGGGERVARLKQNKSEQNFAVIMAVLCVFLLMGVLFESFVLPFSILVSIPFAFVGVYWTLYATGTSFDVMAGVGLVILIGVVVNNAVVLVDRVNQNRAAGLGREEAIVEAGQSRLRPILMTALTTIFGLVPMAAGRSSLIGIPYAPLGRTLMGGMVASTLLTLFVVPLCYTFFDEARQAGQRLWWRLTRRSGGGEAGEG